MTRACPSGSRRLIVASNRIPFTLRRGTAGTERIRTTGGLVTALEPPLERYAGVWIGWPGTEIRRGERISLQSDPYRIIPVTLTRDQVRRFYHGFSNRTLWPLFHTMPGRAVFHVRDWATYQQVNQRFARVAARHYKPGTLVWVNDYQLALMPLAVRQRVERAPIGFFLHIPFPPYDVFRLLPWAKSLLRGMLGADIVGFHVNGYVQNFLDCVERLLGAKVDRRSKVVRLEGASTLIGAFPLGIDFQYYRSLAESAPPSGIAPQRFVLGVDRLDYTKGIPQRILAFAQLLEHYPQYRQRITLLQIAVPSRAEVSEYQDVKREIDELVGRVNGQFATATWTPIRYLYRSVSPERLAALYRDADAALVTPLRDGLNLVAKEFVACQVADPGVLILSHMAGAAETMDEAIHVNPYNIAGTADALHRALSMPEEERRRRLDALQKREQRYNVHAWARQFLARLEREAKRRAR